LTRDGRSVPLQEQPLELLMLLVERADALVTRDDIRARLWPDVAIDYDMGINYAIRQVRLALGPDRRLLQTVPRRGYRLIGPVVPVLGDVLPDVVHPVRRQRPSPFVIAAAFAFVFGAGIVTAHTSTGAFIYQHIVHPDRCPYVRMLIPILRNS
jgi:Transcriptional regulatory protein, C terminal